MQKSSLRFEYYKSAQVALSALGQGPHHAMQIAERLYTQDYISYPRTESTTYPTTFDFEGTLSLQCKNPNWGDYVKGIMHKYMQEGSLFLQC